MDFSWGMEIGRDVGRVTQDWLKQPKIIRDLMGLDAVLAKSGSLEARLATTKRDIRRAQRLRFKTFCVEGGALPSRRNALSRRDECVFDKFCDHLLVVDTDAVDAKGRPKPKVVGTYRLLKMRRRSHLRRFLQSYGIRHRSHARATSQQALPRTWPVLCPFRVSVEESDRSALAQHWGLCSPSSDGCPDRLRQSPRDRSTQLWPNR